MHSMGRYGDPEHFVAGENAHGGDFRRGYPLSWELRLQIIRLHEQGLSIRQIARRTKRPAKTVQRICARYDLTGRPTPGAQAGVRSSPPLLKVPELLYLKVKTAVCYHLSRSADAALFVPDLTRS